jgi:hypothetical protein
MAGLTIVLQFVIHDSKSIQAERGSDWVLKDSSTEEESLIELDALLVVFLLLIKVTQGESHVCLLLNVSSLDSCLSSECDVL